jgi:hypothetical protein
VLDWSYHLLPEEEQRLLRSLAIFPASFGLEAAVAIVRGDGLTCLSATDGIANLVSKSLVTPDRRESSGRWRLLEIRSRNGIDWMAKLPEIAVGLACIADRGAVLDGEVVAYRPDGVSSFELLKARLGDKDTAGLVYMGFDLLALDEWHLWTCRQDDRSDLLEHLLAEHPPTRLRLSERRDDAVAALGSPHGAPGLAAN